MAQGTKERQASSSMAQGTKGQDPSFVTGDVIALQAVNNLYLSWINRGDKNPIEAAKSSIDEFCRFKVTLGKDPWVIALQAANGLYLSRIDRGDRNPIEAAKSAIDVFCWLGIAGDECVRSPETCLLLWADNNTFLSWINRGDTNPIEAAKNPWDRFCLFRWTKL